MEKQRLTWLLQQHLAEKATRQEQQELEALLKANDHEEVFKTVIADMMQQGSPGLIATEGPWQKMIGDIVAVDRVSVVEHKSARSRVFLLRWSIAAAVLVLLGAGWYYFMVKHPPESLVIKTVLPYQVISTAISERKELVLPDGSRIWLNAASSIRYPEQFSTEERSVELSGEAWFDVTHADKIPFVIHSGAITIRVMGTAFDIKAYPNQKSTIVSVQRGKVQVQAGNKALVILEKGRQARITETNTNVRTIDTASVAAWKQGNLYYKDETLGDIVADLQRVYKDSIRVKNNSLKEVVTTASFNRDIGVQHALDILCRITDARLIKKNGIYIIE
jgi:transmembrane sensor